MNSKRFFQYSLALPLIPPLLVLPLWFVRDSINENSPLALVPIVIAYSGIVGGIPYFILAVGLLVWMRNKDLPSIKKALLAAPALMLPIFAACLAIYTIVFEKHPSFNEYFLGLIVFSIFIILFGFVYVGLVFGVEKVLRGR